MPIRLLPSLSSLFRGALRLAWGRLGTLVALALFPLVPLTLASPFIVQLLIVQEAGMVGAEATVVALWATLLAFLGVLLAFIGGIASVAGMIVALTAPVDPGPRAAFREGARRWLAVLWTQLLVAVAVLLAALPLLAFLWWLGGSGAGVTLAAIPSTRILTVLLALLLAVPTFIVTVWYAFAFIPAARGEAWGVRALAVSHRLVHGATGQVFGLLLALVLFELLLSVLLLAFFPGLSLFQSFTYYLATTVLEASYLVVLYRALRQA